MAELKSIEGSVSPIDNSPEDKPQSSWPDLPTSSRFVRRNGWEHRSLPHELTKLPEGIVVPEALQQILAWSLIPGKSWSYRPCGTQPDEHRSGSPHDSSCNSKSSLFSSATTSNGVITPASSTDDVSNSSFKSSVTQFSSSQPNNSNENERSLKSKLLSKMRLGKSDEKIGSAVTQEIPATAECTSCFEELPEAEMTRLKSCRHWYCKECLAALITTAMATEATFPPKCCLSPIPLKQVLKALDAGQREQYQEKAAEYAVPTTERWYCPDKDCLKWIPRSRLKINRDLGYNCPHCTAKLCRTCRGAAHAKGTECPQDFGLEATLETAEIEGWQRCYKCRALVEHNRGCRHMTCRCSAEFCYVCGLRWQTCACTETDAANKRAGVEARRQAHLTQVDEEAAEIARAIAEVEDMERREAEERMRRELHRQREEAEQLRQLEAERLAEEQRRREEAEQAEREFRNTLVRSFEEEWNQVEALYYKIVAFQSTEMSTRHEQEDTNLSMMNVKDEEDAKQEFETISLILDRNASRRRSKLAEKHKTDLSDLEAKQEEDEDDLFLQVQMRLRGKSNKESRMERMLAEIHKQQEEERREVEDRQKGELDELEQKVSHDSIGLRKWHETRVQEARDRHTIALQKFGYTVGADRHYFELVTERRNKMLARHGQNSLNNIEAGEEPTGLSEWEASQIEPSLPEIDDGEPGPSGTSRGPPITVTPTDLSTSGGQFYTEQNKPIAQDEPHNQKQTPISQNETNNPGDLYKGIQQTSTLQRSLSRPPIPGSFPLESTTSFYPLLPPPVPNTQPPPIPHTYSQAESLKPPPLNPHRARKSTSQPHQMPPRINTFQQSPSPLSQTQYPRQPSPLSSTHAVTMASMAASMALSVAPPSATSLMSSENLSGGMGQDRRSSNASSTSTATVTSASTGTLTTKRSKWGFRRKEMNEEEIRRRMTATVGDASWSSLGGKMSGRLNVY